MSKGIHQYIEWGYADCAISGRIKCYRCIYCEKMSMLEDYKLASMPPEMAECSFSPVKHPLWKRILGVLVLPLVWRNCLKTSAPCVSTDVVKGGK